MKLEGREEMGTSELPPAPPHERRPTRWYLIGGGIILLGAILAGAFFLLGGGTPRLQAAAEGCKVTGPHFQVADDGNTLIIDGPASTASAIEAGDLPSDADVQDEAAFYDDFLCVIRAEQVKMPAYVVTQVENTTSLAGRQDASWNGLSASWSYHPDNGVDMEIHEEGG
jgi:hypothetical protein